MTEQPEQPGFHFLLRGKRTPWPLDEAKQAFLDGRLPEAQRSSMGYPHGHGNLIPYTNNIIISYHPNYPTHPSITDIDI